MQELQALWGKDGGGSGGDAHEQLADPPTPWTVMEEFSEKDYLQCLFQKPDEVGLKKVACGLGMFFFERLKCHTCNGQKAQNYKKACVGKM